MRSPREGAVSPAQSSPPDGRDALPPQLVQLGPGQRLEGAIKSVTVNGILTEEVISPEIELYGETARR